MEGKLKLSLVQSEIVWENIDLNFAFYDELLINVQRGTDIVILPELFSTGFTMEVGKMAERMNGKTFMWMKDTAAKYKVSVTGSFICVDNNQFYNRLLWINQKGEYFYYDKRHLFRMGDENLYYTPGKKRLIINYKNWRICPLICYDLRFPVWSRNTDAYDLLIYIANWPAARS